MSNEYLKAADNAKRLLAGFKAVADVADAFEKVGSLVQAEKEARNALFELQGQIDIAKAELANVQDAAAKLKQEAMDVLARAKADADASLAIVSKECEKVIAESKAQAAELLADAKAHADAMGAQAAEAIARRDEAAKDLEDLETRLAKARAQAAKLLGS